MHAVTQPHKALQGALWCAGCRNKAHVRWLSKRAVSGPCLPFPFTFLSLLHTDAVRALRVPNETSNKQTEALPLAGVVGYEQPATRGIHVSS